MGESDNEDIKTKKSGNSESKSTSKQQSQDDEHTDIGSRNGL